MAISMTEIVKNTLRVVVCSFYYEKNSSFTLLLLLLFSNLHKQNNNVPEHTMETNSNLFHILCMISKSEKLTNLFKIFFCCCKIRCTSPKKQTLIQINTKEFFEKRKNEGKDNNKTSLHTQK